MGAGGIGLGGKRIMITPSDFRLKRRLPADCQTMDAMLHAYLMERRRALLTELTALNRLLDLPAERKPTIDKS